MAIIRTPIEIWYQIIREATWVPSWVLNGALYDPIRRPKESFLKNPNQIYPFLRRLFQIKMSIALVCKSWGQICSEFLHEFLFIHQEETIARLADKFRTINMKTHKVLRIDFSPLSWSGHFSSASALIAMCPSLLAVAFHGHAFDLEDLVFEILGESESLRCFEWYIPGRLPKAISSSLRTRNWSIYICTRSHGLERAFESSGSAMFATSCDDAMRSDQRSPEHLEPIRHMVIDNCVDGDSFLNTNHANHAMNILTLCSLILQYQSNIISNLPPSVHTLLINVEDIPISVSIVAKHVRYIGLSGNSTPSSAEFDHYLGLFIGNNTSHLYFPSLRLLQLLDAPLANGLRNRPHQLRLWTRRCSSWGVSLRDESGNQFQG